MKRFFYLLVLVALFSLESEAQADKAEAGIVAIMKEYPVTGLSVAVVKKNKIVYMHAFGEKDRETHAPLATDNMFRIASISKSFSATSIMQLVEAGKLSLDDDAGKLIGFRLRNPKYPDKVITLRMLMSHLSSINDSQGYFSYDAINPDKNPDWAKCYSNNEPGTHYDYCNLNYNMVGGIIEKTSGERFDQYVKHHVLDPLGLYGGYCVDSLDRSKFASIYEYNRDSARFIPSPNAYAPRSAEIAAYVFGQSTPIFSPTGGMKISAPDLARYMIMHKNQGKANGRRIISKKSAIEMQTELSPDEHYGLAIETTQKMIPGMTMTGHTGSAYGLYSAMFFSQDRTFGIVVISNGCDIGYTEGFNTVIRRTVNCLYESFIKK